MENEIKIKTRFNPDLILSEVELPGHDLVKNLHSKIISLQDEGIRKALIELGWTPPEDDK